MESDFTGGIQPLHIDDVYEFAAPRFFDFMNEENEEDISRAERWFETRMSYAPSPFMPEIKEGRTVQIDSLCDFGNILQSEKEQELDVTETDEQINHPTSGGENTSQVPVSSVEARDRQTEEVTNGKISLEFAPPGCNKPLLDEKRSPVDTVNKETHAFPIHPIANVDVVPETGEDISAKTSGILVKNGACTPKTQRIPANGAKAKKIVNSTRKSSAIKMKDQSPCVRSGKCTKLKSVMKLVDNIENHNTTVRDICQESQSIKRQKLDIERFRQILDVKARVLPHKYQEDPIVQKELSVAELVTVFESRTRDKQLPHNKSASHESTTSVIHRSPKMAFTRPKEPELGSAKRSRDVMIKSSAEHEEETIAKIPKFEDHPLNKKILDAPSLPPLPRIVPEPPRIQESTISMIHRRPKLTLTRPKEPQLGTAQRARAVRIKSSQELEEEMLAKIPKFKARPLNKKILDAPSLPPLPRSAPEPPQFQEFHLKTMERAKNHVETSSVISTANTSSRVQCKASKLTVRPPVLETSLRARSMKIKSSQERGIEELEKMPKFKARPLNKKIFESKGDLGLLCRKPQITTPQEFHFATNERLGAPLAVTDIFDKLSLHSESSSRHDQHDIPRSTFPNPFQLHTKERGLLKERQLSRHILEKQLQEEKARIQKANLYPYTTDYPVITPKPQPKKCTRPDAFQLEGLVRHEAEMKRNLEQKERSEKEEAQRRMFKAQPVLREDPIPLPQRERKPLTEVQEYVLHTDHRAVQRSEFDKKIKEKEVKYKRQREENESAKLIEEEKVVKQMRRTMVPQAKPLPKFDHPFQPQKSAKGTTKSKSPLLHVKAREERRREHIHIR